MAVLKTLTIVAARETSARFPEKMLAEIGGQPLLLRVVERARKIGPPVTVACPRSSVKIIRLCKQHSIPFYAGPEDDVLGRITKLAVLKKADHVLRVTGDCPWLDPELGRLTLAWHLESGADLTFCPLEGRSVEAIKTAALVRADRESAGMSFFREHPDEWILGHPVRFSTAKMKLSVDWPDELDRARRLVKTLGG